MAKRQPTKSPLKDSPVRDAGQSLREQRITIGLDKVLVPLTWTFLFAALSAHAWLYELNISTPNPWVWTIITLGALIFLAYRLAKYIPVVKRLRQAEAGERAVGQYLERLREQGYQVFHDVVGESFNVDHVLIGPAGIFTVETKTWSKPAKGEAKLHFDGQKITKAGFEPERNPVIQARAQSSWLRTLLEESTGKRTEVRPVIVFPGWYIESEKGASREIWALNPKALPKFLYNAEQRLEQSDIKLFSYHLSRIVRVREAEEGRHA
jgi:hypothetical protein